MVIKGSLILIHIVLFIFNSLVVVFDEKNRNTERELSLRFTKIIIVRGALFILCRGTNIYNSFWGASEFQDTYHGFVYFLTFSIFLSGFFILLVREKHKKTLYRFLLAKIKGWDKSNRDKKL